jgi:hypothetical protein
MTSSSSSRISRAARASSSSRTRPVTRSRSSSGVGSRRHWRDQVSVSQRTSPVPITTGLDALVRALFPPNRAYPAKRSAPMSRKCPSGSRSRRRRPPPGTGPLMAPSYSDRARPSPGTLVPLRSHVARRSSADAGCDLASSTSEYSYVAPVLCCGFKQGESRLNQPQPRLTRVQAFRRPGQQPLGLTWASWARFYFRILGRSAPLPLLRLSIDHKTFDVPGPESNGFSTRP